MFGSDEPRFHLAYGENHSSALRSALRHQLSLVEAKPPQRKRRLLMFGKCRPVNPSLQPIARSSRHRARWKVHCCTCRADDRRNGCIRSDSCCTARSCGRCYNRGRRDAIDNLIAVFAGCVFLAATPTSAGGELPYSPEAEFHMARLVYSSGHAGRTWRPWWAIDYPDAEYHFTRGLRRLTTLDVADDSQHLKLTDEEIFDYPWLFAQQVGHWHLDDDEIVRLREYVLRGGFVVFDDFHGDYEWVVFADVMRRAFPEWPITRLPETHALMNVLYDLDQNTQIPGRRHLYRAADGEVEAMLHGPAAWHGIYDEHERLVVAINFNMDMGDAWEHADDPVYPVPMTSLAYRFAVNYVIYAMTH